jgi:hypothetical protein
VQAWIAKCTETETTADDAVFSDISSIAAFKLISETKPLVYISSMSTNVVRSFDPETRMYRAESRRFCFSLCFALARNCNAFQSPIVSRLEPYALVHLAHSSQVRSSTCSAMARATAP